MANWSMLSSDSARTALDPETVACPLCEQGGAKREFYSRDRIHGLPGKFSIHRCCNCAAWFIQPWLGDKELLGYYPKEYGRYRHSEALNQETCRGWRRFVLVNRYGYPSADGKACTPFRRVMAWPLSLITAKRIIPFHGAGKILDVGCGGGSYLYRLKELGWEVFGVEPSADGAVQARGLGLNVKEGNLEEAHFDAECFDVVRLSNVVEHLPRPKDTFREIRRILKPEGLVYVTVPNTRSLVFWLFRANWYSLDSPRHVISYSPKTLQLLADTTGFKVIKNSFAAGPFNFVRSMKYLAEETGDRWPQWVQGIPWERSKLIRRTLKPFFYFVDALGYGDFLHATLGKKR